MNSDGYRLKLSPRWTRSLKAFLKAHFRKKPDAAEAFNKTIERLVAAICRDPTLGGHGELEPWPHKSFVQGWNFRKVRFPLDALDGAARAVRLMYLEHPVDRMVVLVWLYSHAEFETRPSPTELAQALREAFEE
jgi:plasmid stabilization system protein ParE